MSVRSQSGAWQNVIQNEESYLAGILKLKVR